MSAPDSPAWHQTKSALFCVELAASGFTLAGIYVGSTTLAGASCYAIALIFWFWLTHAKRLWGLMPLNIATTCVTALNLWRALGG